MTSELTTEVSVDEEVYTTLPVEDSQYVESNLTDEIAIAQAEEDVAFDGFQDDTVQQKIIPEALSGETDELPLTISENTAQIAVDSSQVSRDTDTSSFSNEVTEVSKPEVSASEPIINSKEIPADSSFVADTSELTIEVTVDEKAIACQPVTTTAPTTEVTEIQPSTVTLNNSSPTVVETVFAENVSTSEPTPAVAGTINVAPLPELQADSSVVETPETGNVTNSAVVVTENAILFDTNFAAVKSTEVVDIPATFTPVKPPIEYDFPKQNQPLIGVIDTGFAANNPDIDYSRITFGKDFVANDANPLLNASEGNEHGTHVLGIIAAERNNDIGIDGINDDTPLWVGRAIGSGKWAESLVEFVDAAKESGQPNAVVNLSLDLTQVNPDGSVTTRYSGSRCKEVQ